MISQEFVLAGRAVFTMHNKATGTRFTFRVSRKDPEPGDRYGVTYFVGLLAGPDNTSDYRYLGILDPLTGYVRLTRNSKFNMHAPSVKAIQWALPLLWKRAQFPPAFDIHHEGRCGRCGRALTVPESILTGFGPECADKIGIPMAVIERTVQTVAQRLNDEAPVAAVLFNGTPGCESLESRLFDEPLELNR